MTDHVTRAYLKASAPEDSALRHAVAQSVSALPPALAASCAHRLLPRPMFAAEDEMNAIHGDLTDLFGLLTSLPQRLFDGDLGRFCEALGIDARKAAFMRRLGGGPPPLHGRADMYHDGDSLKLLELNLGSQLGGTDRAELSRCLLEVDAFAAFADEHRLRYIHTGEVIAGVLREAAAPVANGDAPVIALLEADGGLAPYLHLVRSFQEMMHRLGVDLRIGELGQVRERGGKLHLDGTPVDLVLRYFSVDQLCATPEGEAAVDPVYRAHRAGGTVLYTPLESFLYGNKGTLALLSDPLHREAFSASEAALIDRVLPWTRVLTDGPAQVEGTTVDLLEHCREWREQLILKPRGDFGGAGIVAGWECGEQEWKERLLDCRDNGYVVQRRVVPRGEPVLDPQTGRTEDWIAVWDAFLTPHGHAGGHIRAVPVGSGEIVNMGTNPLCRTSGVFQYPAG
ncbi:hypothetical protein ACQPXS_21730 [Streptomyces sp. CA-142005]|uniref:hypothetical protein n=1 Tax=Streptomyces sp. CA-142005 TaxID=3240052 RepID=UPI003D905FC6